MSDSAAINDLKELRAYASTQTQGVAWPTVVLSIFALGGMITFTGLAMAGLWPLWVSALCNIPCFLAAYTCVHEAIHLNIHGRRKNLIWLNDVIGLLLMWPFFHSFTMHKYVHLQHHAHTNDREKDPDAWMAVTGPILIALRACTLVFYYFVYTARMKSREAGSGPFLRRSAVETLIPISLGLMLTLRGYGDVVLVCWLAPALIGVAILGFILDWLVHHPHQGRARIDTTRIFAAPPGLAGKALTWGYLFQNYHLIHHLFPRAPFYSYEQIFQRGEAVLRRQGAKIIHL